MKRIKKSAGQWWRMLLIPELWKQRQVAFCEFEASLVYTVSSKTARSTQRNPVFKNKKRTNKQIKKSIIKKIKDCQDYEARKALPTKPADLSSSHWGGENQLLRVIL